MEADQMLREAVAAEIKVEREAILRVSRQHKELRAGGRPVRRWEAADLQYLMSHVNHQAPQNIAEALGRSYSSVVRKIQQLG